MSNDTSKQTLFRFVSLRNPQLTDTKHRNLGFIFRSEGVEGHFDLAMDSATEMRKMIVLQTAANNFSVEDQFKSEKKLEQSDFANLLKIGRKISKDQTISEDDLLVAKNYYLGLQNEDKQLTASGKVELTKIWDNLVYQTVTQKDFYVKEAIIQILKAIHLGFAQTMNHDEEFIIENGEDYIKKALTAKVVLPSYLFVEGYTKEDDYQSAPTSKIFTVNESNISGAYISFDPNLNRLSASAVRKLSNIALKTQETNVAKTAKSRLETLKAELEKVSTFYQKEYNLALKTAQEQNDLVNKDALKNYKLQRLQAESTFTEGMNEAAKTLAIESITPPSLEPLNFEFRNEINAQDLQNKLSVNALKTFVELFGIIVDNTTQRSTSEISVNLENEQTAILQIEDYQTYADVYQLIDLKISQYNEKIVANTVVTPENVVSIGGAVLSQQKSGSVAEGSYVLTPKSHNLEIYTGSIYNFYYNTLVCCDFDLILDTAEIVESLELTVKTTDGSVYSDFPTDFYQSGNITTIDNIFYNQQFNYTNFSKINQFSAKIFFAGGKTATIDLTQNFVISTPYTGLLKFNSEETELLPCTYQACTNLVSGNNYNVELSLEMPDSNLDVTYILYTLKDDSGYRNTNDHFDKSKNGALITLSNLMGVGGVDVSGIDFNSAKLEVSVKLNDGKVINFTTPILTLGSCVNGSFEIERPKQDSGDTTSSTTVSNNSFIPKGFGIKRLGIADYLKVEQTLHAYVPGEVSHIENIMAREYKEKSTRRLRRQENTTTKSTDTEREKLTDTTSASRFEMQSEISKMLQESTDFGVSTNMHFGGKTLGSFAMNIGANFAHHQAKEESQRQAVTQSQDITTRALDRIVTKVHEERIEKIIEEYEENNKHGFDNTKGDKHVVGVYRWLDKRMKNQIYNYGKRMMFEFMIPEPARLHTLAIDNLKKSNTKVIPVPIDPRTSKDFNMKDYTALSNESTLNYWLGKYNVEIDKKPEKEILIGKSLKLVSSKTEQDATHDKYFSLSDKIIIPEGYGSSLAYSNAQMMYHLSANEWAKIINTVGYKSKEILCESTVGNNVGANIKASKEVEHKFDKVYYNEMPISSMVYDGEAEATSNFTLICLLSPEAEKSWQQKAFNAIIQAYDDAMSVYNSQLAEEESKAKQISEENPNYYRQIEQEILKHNAIAFLTDDDYNNKLGLDLNGGAKSMADYKVNRENLDQYAALVKFMEQAFEWNIMSYNFYPYYWAGRTDWEMMHLSDSVDPLFRSFLQSGMARVIVTVKPGFEDAVNFYFTTGKIWNGGEVPVIGDPMYLSIVDELRETPGKPEGKFWITQIPTSLNMMQEKSIGLVVDTALPLHEEDPKNCENPEMLVKKEDLDFEMNNNQIGGTSNKIIQLSWENMDSQPMENLDFPRIYRCMDQEIRIDRDATWQNTDRASVSYQVLADKLSLIDGVSAEVMDDPNTNGLTLKVDVSKIKIFELLKPGGSDSFDTLKFVTNAVDYISFPNQDADYNIQKIADKNGVNLTAAEVGKKINLDRFLV